MRIYFEKTRSLAFSLIAIAPLLLFYEFFVSFNLPPEQMPVRNAAEYFFKYILQSIGLGQPYMQALLYLAVTGFVIAVSKRVWKLQLPRPALYGYIVLESLIYAVALGFITEQATSALLSLQTGEVVPEGVFAQVLLAIAAGVYEELLFRLIIVGSLMLILQKLWEKPKLLNGVIASAVAASVFSLFHYPSIAMATWDSFLFRLIAGWILGMLYVLRGLGVTVYTHALYDILFIFKML